MDFTFISVGALRQMRQDDLIALKTPVIVLDEEGQRLAVLLPYRQFADYQGAVIQQIEMLTRMISSLEVMQRILDNETLAKAQGVQ